MVELGRSCVHPDWRCGGVILALWGALGEFMSRNGLQTMIGCASVAMRDGGHVAASLWEQLRRTHLAPSWDPDFNSADLPLMMRLDDLPARYRRHFLAG